MSESYTPGVPMLVKKKVEPGSPTEQHAAYKYDTFGNVVATTVCASDFGSCSPEQENPSSSTADTQHPPFRTTKVSYDPAVLKSAAGFTGDQPGYGVGRYPVMTTNAVGQVEYSVYDPLLGAVTFRIGPNGLETCYGYDYSGWKTIETARCGSSGELKTRYSRDLNRDTQNLPLVKTVMVVRVPTDVATWTYADALGRATRTMGRAFDGGFVNTDTTYDSRGRVVSMTKPYEPGTDATHAVSTAYDDLDRVTSITENLDVIDETAKATTSVLNTTYHGTTTSTSRVVSGVKRTRTETKNALGKVASVMDAEGNVISYDYDADGNLSDVHDPINERDKTKNIVHLDYDVLGRKIQAIDPDLGTWHYVYDGYGDLIKQTDSMQQATTMTYDPLGRMVTKSDSVTKGTAEWVYDVASGAGIGKLTAMVSAPDDKLAGACSIPHTTQSTGNRSGRSYTYNDFGELIQVDECVDGKTFATKFEYDGYGRQKALSYPQVGSSTFEVQYHYTSLGFLHYVSDVADQKPYWVAKAMNAAGQITDEQTRNGVETVSTRNKSMGWLMRSSSTSHAQNDLPVESWANTFDEAGNLRSRKRAAPVTMSDSLEVFDYDKLDRLLSSNVKIQNESYESSTSFHYDSLGNISDKDGKSYSYTGCDEGGGAHTVCSVNGDKSFKYDGNGNMTYGNGHEVTYTPFNKVRSITAKSSSDSSAGATATFLYGADGNRVVQSIGASSSDEPARTLYVGLGETGKSLYEQTTKGGSVEHVQFVYAGGIHGGNAFAIRVAAQSATPEMKYYLFDHLGSVTAMTDKNGLVAGRDRGAETTVFGYDAWGKRRSPDGKPADGALDLQPGHREFTSHETIPNLTLINMNGRVYDPDLGRFLSPDPNVQAVADLQNYNRYSYVLNNPLRYTDPTGYSWYSFLSSPMFYVGLLEGAVTIAACAGSGVGCALAVGLAFTVLNSTVALIQGAQWDQVVMSAMVGTTVGIGMSGIGQGFSNPFIGSLVSGAASASTLTLLGAMQRGSLDNLGENLLGAVLASAASSSFSYGLALGAAPVSEASAIEQAGQGGAGSGSDADKGGVVGVKGAGSVVLVRDKDGNVVGLIKVETYGATSSGLEIRLKYVNQSSNLTDWDWVQTIRTNSPLGGATSPYNDPQPPDDSLPFYWTRAEHARMSTPTSVTFSDAPGRTPNGSVINWSAELSLVGQTSTVGHFEIMRTITYGFSMDSAGNVTLGSIGITAPSTFQKNSVP